MYLAWRKFWRYAIIYGPRRALFKVVGRTRRPFPLVWRRNTQPDIAVIGCGQYAFSTLGYFVTQNFGRRILCCFDLNPEKADFFASSLGAKCVTHTAEEAISNPFTRIVYVASNHASHTDYAVKALEEKKQVFIEKPVSVNLSQLAHLRRAVRAHEGPIFAGYNRPFSKAVRRLRREVGTAKGGLSLACFVSGHLIGPDHWYRYADEGTRICGNAGHWIDLFVHMLAWRSLPDYYRVQILSADPGEPDDNFVLSITTGANDIFSLMLTARTEPFEGINETVNVQWGDTIAKIDDFRRMTLWKREKLRRFHFWPKDVGHATGVLQPFSKELPRNWSEIEVSTLLMLKAMEMIRSRQSFQEISVSKELELLDDLEVVE